MKKKERIEPRKIDKKESEGKKEWKRHRSRETE